MALQGLGMAAQKGWGDHQIAVDKDDHIAPGILHTTIAPLGGTAMVLLDQPHMGQVIGLSFQPGNGRIGGAIVNKHDLKPLKRRL